MQSHRLLPQQGSILSSLGHPFEHLLLGVFASDFKIEILSPEHSIEIAAHQLSSALIVLLSVFHAHDQGTCRLR